METILNMFKYADKYRETLLPEGEDDWLFWNTYRENTSDYDILFMRTFATFRYYNPYSEVREILMPGEADDHFELIMFRDDVYRHLMANKKKYDELYRIHVVPDSDYSITDNYRITEVMDKDGTSTDNNTFGASTDTTNTTIGSQSNNGTNITGSQNVNETNRVSPFDTETFNNANENSVNAGARTDTTNTTIGGRNDSSTISKGSKTDNLQNTYTEDYRLTRSGNIGVKTVTEVIREHGRYWNNYEFMTYIFSQICADLLLV